MRSAANSQARRDFAEAIAVALDALKRRGITQTQLATKIASNQIGRKRTWPSPDREAAQQQAQSRWQKRLSAWRNAHQIPADQAELMLAIAVIDPGGSLQPWIRIWQQARAGEDLRTNAFGVPSFPDPKPAITHRWRTTSDGMAATRVSILGEHRMNHPGYTARDAAAQEASSRNHTAAPSIPAMRIATVLTCDGLPADIPGTTQLRTRFLQFLEQPAVAELLASLTSISGEVSWRPGESNGRIFLGAVLTRSDQDTSAPIAWARLIMPGTDTIGTRHESRQAGFILYTEPRTPDGQIAPATALSSWTDRFARALHIPEALARFLTDDLKLATHNDPDTCAAIWLTAPATLVDIEDSKILAGTTPWPHFTGYVIADPTGDPAATAARQLVQHLADYALHLDAYEHLLTQVRRATESRRTPPWSRWRTTTIARSSPSTKSRPHTGTGSMSLARGWPAWASWRPESNSEAFPSPTCRG